MQIYGKTLCCHRHGRTKREAPEMNQRVNSDVRSIRHGIALVMPAALAVGLYVWSMGCGFLADDFLYLNWMRRGLGELLRHVTVASDPQMIRPLPAFGWWLMGGFGWGAAAMHGVSVLLHAAVGVLLARMCGGAGRIEGVATADGGTRGYGGFGGFAFAAVPLFL